MDKYRLFDKVIKCKTFTFYRAQAILNRQPVLVKKLHRTTTWEQILKSKQLTIIKHSKNKHFPTIKQMVKDQDRFYMILEPLQQNLQYVIKSAISHQDILKISRLLIQMILSFKQNSIIPKQIRPSYFFLNNTRNILKLVHLNADFGKDISKLDLVQLEDLKYLSPQQILTSKQIDQRSTIFAIGLIICQLITGKSLINANTKMNYIYQICRLFPQEKFNMEQNTSEKPKNQGETFQKIMSEYNLSNQFIALLRQMLRLDRSQRISFDHLLENFDLIAQNQINFYTNKLKAQHQSNLFNKPNLNQADINSQLLKDIQFQFENKSTLSTIPTIKSYSQVLIAQKNIDDDAVQPIIIKQSSKPLQGKKYLQQQTTKQSSGQSRTTQNNQPSLNTIRRPQLTNYAMNQANLGVQVGLNPSLFSQTDF